MKGLEIFTDQMRGQKIAKIILQMLGQRPDVRLIVHPSIHTYTGQYLRLQIHTCRDHALGQPYLGVSQVANEDSMNDFGDFDDFEVSVSDHKFSWYDLEKSCRTGLPSMGEQRSM